MLRNNILLCSIVINPRGRSLPNNGILYPFPIKKKLIHEVDAWHGIVLYEVLMANSPPPERSSVASLIQVQGRGGRDYCNGSPFHHWTVTWTTVTVQGIDIKLHHAVIPLMSPLGRSLSLQVQLAPIEVLVEMSMTRWWFGIVAFNT